MFGTVCRFVRRLHIGIINRFEPLVVRDVFDKRLHLTQFGFNIFQLTAGAGIGAVNVLDFLFKVSILQKVVLSQIVESTRSLFENGELRFVFVTFAADELDALLNVADEGDTPARGLHLALAVPAPLNALFDPFLGVVVSDGLCTGKTLLSLSTEGDVFSGLDFISGFLHEFQKLIVILRCDDAAVDGLLELLLPACAAFSLCVFLVVHALAL